MRIGTVYKEYFVLQLEIPAFEDVGDNCLYALVDVLVDVGDFGIGEYEAWGHRGNHSQWGWELVEVKVKNVEGYDLNKENAELEPMPYWGPYVEAAIYADEDGWFTALIERELEGLQ